MTTNDRPDIANTRGCQYNGLPDGVDASESAIEAASVLAQMWKPILNEEDKKVGMDTNDAPKQCRGSVGKDTKTVPTDGCSVKTPKCKRVGMDTNDAPKQCRGSGGKDTKMVPTDGCSVKTPKCKRKRKYNSEPTLENMVYILYMYGMETDRYHSAYSKVKPSRFRQRFHQCNPSFYQRFHKRESDGRWVPIAGHEAEMRRGKERRNGHKRCPKEM